MNPAEKLRDYVGHAVPKASVTLTSPLHVDGFWSLDAVLNGKRIVVEWSSATGFAVSTIESEGFGERPDEAYESLEATLRRVIELLTSNERTSPPYAVPLSWLRERRGETQLTLARKLGIQQATVSGIERRKDIQISTLRRFLEGLGGRLEIFGVFPNARYAIEAAYPNGSPVLLVGARDTEVFRREMGSIPYEEVFVSLQMSGNLQHATKAADNICSRHAVIEIP